MNVDIPELSQTRSNHDGATGPQKRGWFERYIPEERDEHYNVTKESERVDMCPACLKKRNIEDIEETEEDQGDLSGAIEDAAND